MSQIHKHTIPANIADRCLINPQQYEAMYQQSINAPDTFWGEQGKNSRLDQTLPEGEKHLLCPPVMCPLNGTRTAR